MRNLDLSPFRRSTVGFDRLFEMLESGIGNGGETYPPFDLEQDGEDRYRITLAVAGFRKGEIEVTAQQNLLVVTGRRQNDEPGRYVHRGIAARSFERRFALGDYVQVRGAELADGLLTIELEREIPDAMKPRRIEIGGAGAAILADRSAENENEEQAAAA